jgi:hypothetical protein
VLGQLAAEPMARSIRLRQRQQDPLDQPEERRVERSMIVHYTVVGTGGSVRRPHPLAAGTVALATESGETRKR